MKTLALGLLLGLSSCGSVTADLPEVPSDDAGAGSGGAPGMLSGIGGRQGGAGGGAMAGTDGHGPGAGGTTGSGNVTGSAGTTGGGNVTGQAGTPGGGAAGAAGLGGSAGAAGAAAVTLTCTSISHIGTGCAPYPSTCFVCQSDVNSNGMALQTFPCTFGSGVCASSCSACP